MTNWQLQNVMWIARLSESLNANVFWLLAEDRPSERRLHIRSLDVITFAWRVTKYGGSLWERSAHDSICRKDRTSVWKIFVAMLILLSTRCKQQMWVSGFVHWWKTLLTVKCSVNCTNQWIIESLNANRRLSVWWVDYMLEVGMTWHLFAVSP